jgi:hypothetical protein
MELAENWRLISNCSANCEHTVHRQGTQDGNKAVLFGASEWVALHSSINCYTHFITITAANMRNVNSIIATSSYPIIKFPRLSLEPVNLINMTSLCEIRDSHGGEYEER